MMAGMLFISGSEVFIVLIVVLLLFGSKKIPELAKGLGKGMKEFKRATEDIKRELDESTSGIRESANEIRRDIDQVKHKLESDTSDIRESTTRIREDVSQVKEKIEKEAFEGSPYETAGKNNPDLETTTGETGYSETGIIPGEVSEKAGVAGTAARKAKSTGGEKKGDSKTVAKTGKAVKSEAADAADSKEKLTKGSGDGNTGKSSKTRKPADKAVASKKENDTKAGAAKKETVKRTEVKKSRPGQNTKGPEKEEDGGDKVS